MPVFGDPEDIAEGESIYWFEWASWDGWPQRRKEGATPTRVLWEEKSGCTEKYRMVPLEPPVFED